MASVNKVILVGNLGADPELRYTAGGRPVASFRIATTEQWTTKDGEKGERTEWHRIVAWARLGEKAADPCLGRPRRQQALYDGDQCPNDANARIRRERGISHETGNGQN